MYTRCTDKNNHMYMGFPLGTIRVLLSQDYCLHSAFFLHCWSVHQQFSWKAVLILQTITVSNHGGRDQVPRSFHRFRQHNCALSRVFFPYDCLHSFHRYTSFRLLLYRLALLLPFPYNCALLQVSFPYNCPHIHIYP